METDCGSSPGGPNDGGVNSTRRERRCSLVITTFNGIENLGQYLPGTLAVVAKSPECDEIVLVDDGSIDDSVDYVKRTFPRVKVVSLPENRGFGAAANAGFEAARNEFVALISNDMVVTEGFFSALFESLVSSDVFHVSARQVGPEGELQKGRCIPFYVGDFRIWKVFCREPEPSSAPRKLYHHFCGAIGLYDRRLFLALGGFDDLFLPFFVEENDLCYRAWRRGYRVLYEPRACVIHHHRSSTIANKFDWTVRKVQYRKNRLLFVWKNVDDPLFLLIHGVYLIAMSCFSWMSGHLVFYRGFLSALGRWSEVRRKRRDELPRFIRSDREVYREFSREIDSHDP